MFPVCDAYCSYIVTCGKNMFVTFNISPWLEVKIMTCMNEIPWHCWDDQTMHDLRCHWDRFQTSRLLQTTLGSFSDINEVPQKFFFFFLLMISAFLAAILPASVIAGKLRNWVVAGLEAMVFTPANWAGGLAVGLCPLATWTHQPGRSFFPFLLASLHWKTLNRLFQWPWCLSCRLYCLSPTPCPSLVILSSWDSMTTDVMYFFVFYAELLCFVIIKTCPVWCH